MSTVATKLAAVRERIAEACRKVGRAPEHVKILAVTKTHPPEVVAEAIAAGVDAIGENRVQEAASKKPLVPLPALWHLVGPLQRNKATKAVELFDLVATVDRIPLVETLETLLARRGRVMPVMVEVNTGREPQKSGVLEEDLETLAARILERAPHLELTGLLTVPPYHPDPERSRPYFRRLAELAHKLEARFALPPLELSMGMSEDFQVAVEEGATWVRLGRVLFGERR